MGRSIYLIGKNLKTGPYYMGYTEDKRIAKRFKKERHGFSIVKVDQDQIDTDELHGDEILESSYADTQIVFECEEQEIVDNYYQFLYDIPDTIEKFVALLRYTKYDKKKMRPLLDELDYIYRCLRHDDMNGDLEDYLSIQKFAKFYVDECIDGYYEEDK